MSEVLYTFPGSGIPCQRPKTRRVELNFVCRTLLGMNQLGEQDAELWERCDQSAPGGSHHRPPPPDPTTPPTQEANCAGQAQGAAQEKQPAAHHGTAHETREGEQPRKTAAYAAVFTRPKAHGGSEARPLQPRHGAEPRRLLGYCSWSPNSQWLSYTRPTRTVGRPTKRAFPNMLRKQPFHHSP